MTWHARLKQKAESNRKAAARLFPEWRKKARKEVEREKTTEQALANKIGSLNSKGDATGWWRERPILRQLLADLVDLEVDEIFGAPVSAHVSTFREFPALPPLERNEAPCRMSPSGSVFELTCAAVDDSERRRHWIVVPPGGGKTLSIELLRSRFPGEINAQTVVRLGEAVELTRHDAGRPIVVEVEEPDPSNDMTSIRALEMHRASVVVLAPFKQPNERTRELATSLPETTPRALNGAWSTSHAVFDQNWLVRLLTWVDTRLASSPRDGKFDKDEVLEWLDAHPAVLRAIRSPGELLAICADFDAYGSDGSPQERAERWLRSIGMKGLPQDAPRSWSAYTAADCVAAMMETHVLDCSTVPQERSFTGWSALVPPNAKIGENTPGSDLVVGFLRSAGLLRADERGAAPFPGWVANAFAQRRLAQLVKNGDVRAWGAITGDVSRQHLVDDMLDALQPGALRTAGEALLLGMATKAITFADVAALEALVAALGRRLAGDDPDQRDADLAKRALMQQLEHLVSGANIGVHPVPTTRRNRDEWFLSGWAISLATSGAEVEVPTDLRWEFPGWSPNLRLSEAEQHHHFPWWSGSPREVSNAVQALMQLTPQVVARLTPADVPKEVPRLLLPALMLAEGWNVGAEHLGNLAGTWEETVLVAALQRLDDERRRSLAGMFWKLASDSIRAPNAASVAERIVYLRDRHAPLLPFVLENLPAVIVEETARTAGTHRNSHRSDPRALRHLNLEQRAAAVRGRLSRDVRFDEVRELVEVLDGDDLDALLDVVRTADRTITWEFSSRIWHVLPERAQAEAQRAFDNGLPAAEAWFRTAPRAKLGALAEIVERAKAQPQWVRDWALAKILDAGIYSESLYRFMRPESGDSGQAPTKKRAK